MACSRKQWASVWRGACAIVAAALASHVIVVVSTDRIGVSPLSTSLLATFAFAGVWLVLSRQAGSCAPSLFPSLGVSLFVSGLAAGGIYCGELLISTFESDGQSFYCEAVVPWRIEIAIFGAFALALLAKMAESRWQAWFVYPVTLLALAWIAPFYGFFIGPVFFAHELQAHCAHHGLFTVVLAAAGMLVGERLGNNLGAWFSMPRDGARD